MNLGVQQYADDTQGYVHSRAENAADSMGLLQDAILKIESWMSSNRLKLNQNKTQYIWIGTQFQLAKINKQQLARMFPGVDFLESVVDLGVVIDQELRMDRHISKLSQTCFYQLRQLRTVRQSLSDTAAKMLINAFVQGHRVKIRAPGQSGHGPSYIEQLRTQNTIDNVDCGPCRALPGP